MNTSVTKSKGFNPRNILGGLGFFEEDFEKETSLVSSVVGGVTESFVSLVKEEVAGVPEKSETNTESRFPKNGSINFKENRIEEFQDQQAKQLKDQKETDRKKAFFQSLKEDMERSQRAKEKLLFEEEINDIATNLPTEQKNELLHYQASYRDRSIYQRAELRRKLVEQRSKNEKQEKTASITSPAKQPSAMEGAFEGRSGNQGGGTANLSAQAVG